MVVPGGPQPSSPSSPDAADRFAASSGSDIRPGIMSTSSMADITIVGLVLMSSSSSSSSGLRVAGLTLSKLTAPLGGGETPCARGGGTTGTCIVSRTFPV